MPASQTADLSAFPIGTIVAFGGDLSQSTKLTALNEQGWYLCDGTSFEKTKFPQLFAAIGTVSGGSESNFNVPDLRNRFMRGTLNNAAGIDPDVGTRVAAAAGGATGNNTGSLEKSATALPANSLWSLQHAGLHTHTCVHLNSDMHMAWSGSTYRMARWNAPASVDTAGAHYHNLTGFDAATVPVNVALYFIIKAGEPTAPTGNVPAGAIAGYAGALPTPPASWLRCDGAAYGVNRYPNLFNTLFYNYGGDGETVLNVPDFRGYFLRGTSHLTNHDPDAGSRHPLNTGGNSGDAIGSVQFYATRSPNALAVSNAGTHSHNITLVPQTDHHAAWGASGPAAYNCMVWTDGTTTSSQDGDHCHTVTGGDKECRPENIYVDFLVADDTLTQAAPPIGSIMSFGGDITDPGVIGILAASGWLACNGSALRIAQYPALYDVIGTTFGSAPLKFNLPDLRGYFVTGAGKTAVGTKLTVSTTGTPVVPLITTTNGDHQHTMYNIPTDTHVIDVVAGVDLAENNPNGSPTSSDGQHTHVVSGGDSESRPPNVYVDYIIRFQ
jgi:microcystin-dependent protein